ncbi:hypothetical protein PHMEG_00023807 [Phytophthora megakarya]|uniref:Uncharacterized protein n=1 Tax=Phytophthora megakarya TaxID=4795 RepID=A0A225VG73_9STRA|nr:hypothetical protein PHMEG_00023807 [Phytophthora megakarya]
MEGVAVSAFIDCGASFNAITPALATRLHLQVMGHNRPLKLKLGVGRVSLVPHRTCSISLSLSGFPEYQSTAFVMEVPESQDVTFGMPWLVAVNPLIDWANRVIHRAPTKCPVDIPLRASAASPTSRWTPNFTKSASKSSRRRKINTITLLPATRSTGVKD